MIARFVTASFASSMLLSLCCAAAPGDEQSRAQRTVIADQKVVADASIAVDAAAKALTAAAEKRARDFDRSPDLKAAQKEVADRLAAVEAARKRVLQDLHATSAYEEASAKRAAAQTRVDALKNKPDSPECVAAIREVNRVDAVINALEDGAMQADAPLKTARETLIAATAALKAVKNKFMADAPNDPELSGLRKAHDDAQQKLTRAQAKLELDVAKLQAAELLGE